MISQKELFDHGEAERAMASAMTNEELAKELLTKLLGAVYAVEIEFRADDADYYKKQRGVLREAAYRLANVRSHEEGS